MNAFSPAFIPTSTWASISSSSPTSGPICTAFMLPDLFCIDRNPAVKECLQKTLYPQSPVEHKIEPDTLKTVFRAVEILGTEKVIDLCNQKSCLPEQVGYTHTIELGEDNKNGLLDWINQLDGKSLFHITRCITAIVEKRDLILGVFIPGNNKNEEVPLLQLDHFIGTDSYQLFARAGALYLKKVGVDNEQEASSLLVMETVAVLGLFKDSLYGLNLTGLNLSSGNLSGADLRGSNLCGVNFTGTKLNYANLTDANMSSTNLSLADLSDAEIIQTDFSGAEFDQTDMRRTKIAHSKFLNSALNADFRNAKISATLMSNVILMGAKFEGCEFRDVLFFQRLPKKWDEYSVYYYLGNSNVSNSSNLLTVIDAINNRSIKLSLFRQLVFSLNKASVGRASENLERFLNNNPTFQQDKDIFNFMERNQIKGSA